MKNLIVSLSCLFFLACNQTPKEEQGAVEIATNPEYPQTLQKALQAHGGADVWKSNKSLQFDMESTLGGVKNETHLIDLNNRKVRISSENYTLGMDGKEVWVTPNKAAFGNVPPRFYHNLLFYFFTIPHIFTDPGINFEELGEVTVAGKKYVALKVSYEAGVGDADKDLYIAHFDPDTYRLALLLYTVTYFSGEKHENYNALKYDNWQQVDGLWVPASFEGYKFENDSLKELRYQSKFSNVIFSKESPDQNLFEIPENAEIDSLIVID